MLNKKLNDPKLKDKTIFFYSSEHPHKRTNAAFLISAWALLCLNKTPEEAFLPFRNFHLSFPSWVGVLFCIFIVDLLLYCTVRALPY